jgi:hypothetical protein
VATYSRVVVGKRTFLDPDIDLKKWQSAGGILQNEWPSSRAMFQRFLRQTTTIFTRKVLLDSRDAYCIPVPNRLRTFSSTQASSILLVCMHIAVSTAALFEDVDTISPNPGRSTISIGSNTRFVSNSCNNKFLTSLLLVLLGFMFRVLLPSFTRSC